MKLGTAVGLGPGDIVLDDTQLRTPPPKKKGGAQHFSAHIYCGQTVAHLSNCWAVVYVLVIFCYVFWCKFAKAPGVLLA